MFRPQEISLTGIDGSRAANGTACSESFIGPNTVTVPSVSTQQPCRTPDAIFATWPWIIAGTWLVVSDPHATSERS